MKIPRRTFADPVTGREVIQLTEDGLDSHAQYAFNYPFTSDSSQIIYPSDRSGRWGLYRVAVDGEDHEALFIEEEVASYSVYSHIPSDTTFFLSNGEGVGAHGTRMWRIDHRSGEKQLLMDAGEDLLKLPIPSESGNYVAYVRQSGNISRIERMRLDSGEIELLHESSDAVLDHPSLCPLDEDTVLMNRYGRYKDLREQRMWVWKKAWGETRPVFPQPNYRIVGHDVWVPGSKEIVYFYHKMHDESREWILDEVWRDGIAFENDLCEVGIGFYDVELDREVRSFKVDCWHPCPSLDGRYVVMDSSYAPLDITLMDSQSGEATLLCTAQCEHLPNNNQLSHPHPGISPDNKWAIFTSNMNGRSAVYLCATDL